MPPFQQHRNLKIPKEEVIIWVDSIFYSQDSLKLVAFLIWKFPNNPSFTNSTAEYSYSGTVFTGFRESKKQIWDVYVFPQFQPTEWSTYKKVHKLFRQYYLNDGEFKSDYEYIIDKNGEWVSNYFGYNLDQPEFWIKSVVWQKGARIPSYYNFQLRGNYGPKDIHKALVNRLEVIYPQYILDMFR